MDITASRLVVLADRLGVEVIGPGEEPGEGDVWLTWRPEDGRATRVDLLSLFERLADRLEALERR